MDSFDDFLDWFSENHADEVQVVLDREAERIKEDGIEDSFAASALLADEAATFRLRCYHEWLCGQLTS